MLPLAMFSQLDSYRVGVVRDNISNFGGDPNKRPDHGSIRWGAKVLGNHGNASF